LWPALTFGVVTLAGWLARGLFFRALNRWAAKSETRLDDLLIEALRAPLLLWVAILGLHMAVQASALPDEAADWTSKALLILWIVSLTVAGSKLASAVVKHYGTKVTGALPVTSLTQNLASMLVATAGVLILLNTLGVSVTPILTALGVGGLAVALALQDTLSNLFAGFYISLAGQVRVGDYIKLEGGQEGYVTDISWRSTTMRALPNNLIVVPNSKLAQAIVTNFHLPEKRLSLLIPVSVSYDCDPERVEQVLIDEALLGAEHIAGLMKDPPPFVRFNPGFGESSLDFTLVCQVNEFGDQFLAQHELRKRLFRRFRKEGIEIPFPIRTLYVKGGENGEEPSDSRRRLREIVG